MNQLLNNKYPYLSNFFRAAIEQNRLFHSLIFCGSNNLIQYAMSLEIARQLNCLETGAENCNCQNCRWIRENKHPSVMTISKIDNKTDSSKTVISEEQINAVLDTLVNSSDFHRVFIFCDAQIKKLSLHEINEYETFNSTGFSAPVKPDDEKAWYPSGINTGCFSSVAANAMLKSIEEPSSNVTFIFLANNKDDILQTIVSRSQIFYISDIVTEHYDTSFFDKYLTSYPVLKKETALDFAENLLTYQIQNDFSPKYILDCIQYFLSKLIKLNFENKILINIIYKDIEKIENSKKMIDAYIKEQTVYEDLAFYLTKVR